MHPAHESRKIALRADPVAVPRFSVRRIPWVVVASVIVSLFALLPLGFVIWMSIQTGWSEAYALIVRPRVGELLVNTACLVLLTVPIACILAIALAWLTERSDLPGVRLWAWMCVAPLAIPAFVHSYAWVTMLPSLHGLAGGVLVSVLAYFPFLYLPIIAMLRRLDPALEDASASLGDGPAKVFVRVVLPQLRLAICGGCLLVALHLLAEYGLFALVRFDTFTTAIVDQYQSTFNGAAGNMLAGVLVVCCLGVLGLDMAVRGDERYARVGSGAARRVASVRLGGWTWPCLGFLLVTMSLAIGIPLLTIGRWLISGGVAVWKWEEIGPALGQTVLLALAGGLLAAAVALPIAWLSIRSPGRLPQFLERSNYVVGSLPSAVVALALVTVTVRLAMPLYQTFVAILVAYALMFLPRAIIGMRASIAQAPMELEQAAAGLGKSPLRAVWSTTVKLSAPGAAAGVALVSLGIMNELTATQMLAPNGTHTLAMRFWSLSSEIDYAGAAPYALILILASLPLTWLLYVQSKRMVGR